MQESLTEGNEINVASNEPTTQSNNNPAAETNQEAISNEPATNVTANTNKSDDEGLTNFAKSQGIESLEDLSDREKRLLKIARDNQKSYRQEKTSKITDVHEKLNTVDDNGDDTTKFKQEFNQFRYEQKTSKFWSDENKNKNLEPEMVKILNEKAEQFGQEYAKNLSNDLEALYNIALAQQSISGNEDEIRKEERDSINRKLNASATGSHASTSQAATGPVKIDSDWIRNEYNSKNPEHRALVDAYYAK